MISFPMMPGVEIHLLFLIALGCALGMVTGFIGAGGFLMPTILIILGFPTHLAVGTSLAWITGNSIIGVLRHRQLGNVDMKLGLLLMIGAIGGVEIGVKLLNWSVHKGIANTVVLSSSIFVLFMVGVCTLFEPHKIKMRLTGMVAGRDKVTSDINNASISTRLQRLELPPMIYFAKPGLTISLWLVLAIGFIWGVLAGFIGIGGGLVMIPSLIHIIGLSPFTAVGTNIFQVIFSSGFGFIRHTISGNVIIVAAFLLLLGSSIGTQIGVHATRYSNPLAMRYVFASSVLIGATGAILKLISVLTDGTAYWLQIILIVVTFGGLALLVAMIALQFLIASMNRGGRHIPNWAEPFILKDD